MLRIESGQVRISSSFGCSCGSVPVVSRTRAGGRLAGERIEYGPQLIHEAEQALVLDLL